MGFVVSPGHVHHPGLRITRIRPDSDHLYLPLPTNIYVLRNLEGEQRHRCSAAHERLLMSERKEEGPTPGKRNSLIVVHTALEHRVGLEALPRAPVAAVHDLRALLRRIRLDQDQHHRHLDRQISPQNLPFVALGPFAE